MYTQAQFQEPTPLAYEKVEQEAQALVVNGQSRVESLVSSAMEVDIGRES